MVAELVPIVLIDKTRVPLKSDVGVIDNTAVEVASGPVAPLAVIPAVDVPPKLIVIEPAVLPVMV